MSNNENNNFLKETMIKTNIQIQSIENRKIGNCVL